MRQALSELQHLLRQWLRAPAFVITAVLTLAIGMGVNAVAFGVVNGLLFKGVMARGLPGVGRVATTPGDDEGGHASLAELQVFTDATRESLDIAAEGRSTLAWRHDGTTDTAWTLFVSSNYFAVVQAPAVAGSLSVDRASGGPPSAVVSERFWRDRLAAAPLAGLSLRLNNREVAVAGIVAERFTGPAGLYSPDVWLPLSDTSFFATAQELQQPDTRWLFVLGRLRDHASAAQVQGQLEAAASDLAREYPETHRGRGATFRMLDGGNSELRGLRNGAALAMAVIGLVLLLACFNVANLLLARAADRERDLGIRAALGAGRSRLVRLVMMEGAALAVLSGAAALVVASWTQALVRGFAMPIDEPQYIDLAPDARVVAFIAVLVVIAGVLPGLWPAVSAARIDVLRVLGSQGANPGHARPARLQRWLVGVQVAGSTAFLTLAALLLQSSARLAQIDLGFDGDHLIVAEFEPARHGYDERRVTRYLQTVSERSAALPGVRAVATAQRAPFFIGFSRTTAVWPATGACADACPAYDTYAVGPGYFATTGIALTKGREFESRHEAGAVIVNAAFARSQWPDGDAVGRPLRLGAAGQSAIVIGVAASAHARGLDRDTPALYVPLSAADLAGPLALIVRTTGGPGLLVRAVREAVLAADPDVSLTSVKTMRERTEVQLWPVRTGSRLFSICGGLALLLATVGLVSLVAHAVSRRQREFGVRMSLGATRRDLAADIMRSSLGLLLPGLAVGLLMAGGLAQLSRAALVGVDVLHPATYLAVAAVHAALVVAACVAPALRASRVDPLVSLRAL